MSGTSDTRCGCGGGAAAVRIVRGNDFTVEASASVWDSDKGIYVPFDLSGAEDVELNIVGLYSKVAGGDASVAGNRVSAGFTGAVGAGAYGVEVLFRDSGGRGRVFERGLFEVVEDSGDATIGTGAEGGSGEGLNVSVDVRTRTVRIGQTVGVTDYNLLDNKPSIGGAELEGDRTAEELGLYSREEADALLDGKADKAGVPTKTSELTNDSGFLTEHQDLSEYAKTTDIPTNTSQLTNDSDYAVKSNIPTKLSQLTDNIGLTPVKVDLYNIPVTTKETETVTYKVYDLSSFGYDWGEHIYTALSSGTPVWINYAAQSYGDYPRWALICSTLSGRDEKTYYGFTNDGKWCEFKFYYLLSNPFQATLHVYERGSLVDSANAAKLDFIKIAGTGDQVLTDNGAYRSIANIGQQFLDRVYDEYAFDISSLFEKGKGDAVSESFFNELWWKICLGVPLFAYYKGSLNPVEAVKSGTDEELDIDLYLMLSSVEYCHYRVSNYGMSDTSHDAEVTEVESTVLQPILRSGESIKTVNGESLLGSGDISVSLRQLTYSEKVPLWAVAEKAKASTGEMFTITEAQYNALAALPDAGLIGNILIAKRAEKEGDYTLYYLSGISEVNDALYSDFMFASATGEDGAAQYVAAPYLMNSVPKSVRLTANADGTLTADNTPSTLTRINGLLTSFPVMIVWRSVSSQVTKPNNVRCCFAQDVQTLKNDSSYSDTIQTVFLSLNGVYYKWVGTTLTPVRSAVGQTPVVYTFAEGDDGAFGDVGMDDTGRFSIIDELEFKAANPTKSNLMVKVVSVGESYWLTNVSLADGVITCSGYVPRDKATLTLAITAEGKVSMTLTKDDTLTIDSALSETSENPVQNKAVKAALDEKADKAHTHTKSDITDFPANVSAFSNDAGYLTEHQSLDGYSKTTDVPTNTSQLTNDAGYQTAAQVQTMIDNAVTTALNTEV